MNETEQAFMRLVRPQWQRLHAVARRYCGRTQDATDLVQETLLRAWRSFSLTVEHTHSRAWLFVIMRSVVIDWGRTAARRIHMSVVSNEELTDLAATELGDPFPLLPGMGEDQFREFLDSFLAKALDSLDPVYREVIVLSVGADLNYREIAEILDCPVGTVMSRMARARRALRERLADRAQAGLRTKEGRR